MSFSKWIKDKLGIKEKDRDDEYMFFEVDITGVGYMSNSFFYKTITLYTTPKQLKDRVIKDIGSKYKEGIINFPRFSYVAIEAEEEIEEGVDQYNEQEEVYHD